MKKSGLDLKGCGSHEDVQTDYKHYITQNFGYTSFRTPFFKEGIKHDGILEYLGIGLKLLGEFKYHEYKREKCLLHRNVLVDSIVQVIYYLKKIEKLGEQIPNVVFIGDELVCYVFHSNLISKYLDYELDWEIAPNQASSENPELCNEIYKNDNIVPKALEIEKIDPKEIIDNIKFANKKVTRKMTITELTLYRFFLDFTENVLIKPEQFDANKLKGIFVDLVNNPLENGLLENNNNILVTKNFGHIKVNGIKFKEFFSYVQDTYPMESRDRFLEICDRLIEDYTRRFQGEFYTPTIWTNEAHRMIEQEFGLDWKEKYTVWDPAWGTGNLTRDYYFKELYCSTLNDTDLKIGERYNSEAVKFRYDFLNDDVSEPGIDAFTEYKLKLLAPGLVKAFEENRPIIIFMNPPFSFNSGGEGIITKTQISQEGPLSETYKIMKKNKTKVQPNVLYLQFLYKIILIIKKYKLKNLSVAFYSNPGYLFYKSLNKFRELLFDTFSVKQIDLLKSSNFSNTAGFWAISFSIFRIGKTISDTFTIKVKDIINFQIECIETKVVTNTDKKVTLQNFLKEKLPFTRKIDYSFTSGLEISNNESKTCSDVIGYNGFTIRNNIGCTEQFSNLSSVPLTNGGLPSSPFDANSFQLCVVSFSVKRLIASNFIKWYNLYEEILKPDIDIDNIWINDCIIYSIFNRACHDTSLRDLSINDKKLSIENQLFWLPNQLLQDLSNKYNFKELYQDTKIFNQERFVYLELQKVINQLSSDALEVLKRATELLIKSFPERVRLYDLHPEWHLNSWDAGWYQIKLVLKETMKDELNDFRDLYKKFEERMREGVYKFGFLK